MADLKETDEPVEKARMRFSDGSVRRVSQRQKRAIRTQNATDKELRAGKRELKAPQYRGTKYGNTARAPLSGGTPKGGKRPIEQRAFFRRRNSQLTSLRDKSGNGTYNRSSRLRSLRSYRGLVRKSSDPLTTLYSAIEKAKPLLARGKDGARSGVIGGRKISLERATGTYGLGTKKSPLKPMTYRLTVENGSTRHGYNMAHKDSRARGKDHLSRLRRGKPGRGE